MKSKWRRGPAHGCQLRCYMSMKNVLGMSFVIARHRGPNAYVTLAPFSHSVKIFWRVPLLSSQHTLSGYAELYNERASTLAWESLIWAWLYASISGYHISLPGLSDGKDAASSILPGSSLRMSSGSVGSWRELHLRNHKNIPTWLITSSVPCARSVGSVPLLEDGRRTLGPNTVAKLFCPILFWSWCTLNLWNNYYKFKLEKQT